MSIAILCDFDETISLDNIAHLILDRFGDRSWRNLRRRYLDGIIPPEEYFEQPFTQMQVSQHEMYSYVQEKGRIRDGFSDLAQYCQGKGITIAIVSLGLDFYIKALISQHGMGWIPIYAINTIIKKTGMEFRFPYSNKNCKYWGICKCDVVEMYRRQGNHIVYIGDGSNDLCAAKRSDIIYARGKLDKLCKKEKLIYRKLKRFENIINDIENFRSVS